MERTTFFCDVCGVEKKESNHWWRILLFNYNPHAPLQLYRWDGDWVEAAEHLTQLHLCGHACVIQKVSEFMTVAPPNPVYTHTSPPVGGTKSLFDSSQPPCVIDSNDRNPVFSLRISNEYGDCVTVEMRSGQEERVCCPNCDKIIELLLSKDKNE